MILEEPQSRFVAGRRKAQEQADEIAAMERRRLTANQISTVDGRRMVLDLIVESGVLDDPYRRNNDSTYLLGKQVIGRRLLCELLYDRDFRRALVQALDEREDRQRVNRTA